MTSAANLYHSVIQDVITNVRDAFQDEAVDENVLQELKALWEAKLVASRTIEQTPRPGPPDGGRQQQPPGAARHDQQHQQQPQQQNHGTVGAAANGMDGSSTQMSPQQLLITDPNRLMPVQITIPAQPGHPNSVPKALTVQVPAHALHPGTPSSAILQQVLTQAITQALSLPDVIQAALILQSQINVAFKLDPNT